MLGESFAGNVESGAVVHRSPDERQSEGHLHGFAKRQTLYRHHRLIVITSDHRVELAASSPQENSISRERPVYIYIIKTARGLDGRHDLRRFLHAKQATFSSVRIQRRDRNTRTLDAPTLKLTMRETDHFYEAIAFHESNRFGKRNVRR